MNHSQYHEQRLRVAINRRTNAEQGSVNNRIPPEFVSCSEDGMKCTVRYRLKPEMRNPMGWLHGGVTSAMMDMGMGLLVYYNADFHLCPTATMTVNYIRPGRIGGNSHRRVGNYLPRTQAVPRQCTRLDGGHAGQAGVHGDRNVCGHTKSRCRPRGKQAPARTSRQRRACPCNIREKIFVLTVFSYFIHTMYT